MSSEQAAGSFLLVIGLYVLAVAVGWHEGGWFGVVVGLGTATTALGIFVIGASD